MLDDVLKDQGWWLEAWRHLKGDSERLRALRAAGDTLCERSLWKVIHGELVVLGANSAERSEIHGRLALAAFLQVVARVAPRERGAIVEALSRREHVADFAAVASFAEPLLRTFDTFRKLVAPGDDDTLSALAGQGEIVLWDAEAAGDGPEARKEQARYILAYRDATGGLRDLRIGVLAAARWAIEPTMRKRLERVGGRLEPRMLLDDLIAVAALAALRFRVALAGRGITFPVPDVGAFLATRTQVMRAIAANEAAKTAGSSAPAAPVARVAVPVVQAPAPTVDSLPPEASAPPSVAVPTSLEANWLIATREWARETRTRLEHLLLDVPEQLEASRMSTQLIGDVRLLEARRTLRPQEAAQLALVVLLDEAHRTLRPKVYAAILAALALDPGERRRAEDVAKLWIALEPMFGTWANELDPEVDPKDKVRVLRTLSRRGEILPWDDDVKGSEQRRRKAQLAAIDAVYCHDEKGSAQVRKAAYWYATLARNDDAHTNSDSLWGRVSASEVLVDVIALAAQATCRFLLRRAEERRSQASVPSMEGLVALRARLASRKP